MKTSIRKRLFAWILKKGDSVNHRIYSIIKKGVFHNVYGTVVEVGPGSGVNFEYLPAGINWIGIEPNEAFHSVLASKATVKNITAKLLPGDASQIPLPDNMADFLICTLVLCSVDDPWKAISEFKRVLKPGGKLIFIEHVAAPERSRLRTFQNICNPMNRFFADGCNCNRETWKYFAQSGFDRLEINHELLKGTMPLHTPHIVGYAIK